MVDTPARKAKFSAVQSGKRSPFKPDSFSPPKAKESLLEVVLNQVRERTGFHISFSDLAHVTEQFSELYLPVSLVTHQSALCRAAKTTLLGESACMHCKHIAQKIARRRHSPWLGTCDAGVQEVVWPIWYEDTLLGTLHFGLLRVQGASQDLRARLQKRAGKTEVPLEVLSRAADALPVASRKELLKESRHLHVVEELIRTVLERHQWMPFHFLKHLSDAVGIRKDSVVVRRAFDYVQKNYKDAISSSSASKRLGYEAKYFARIFSRDAGLHFHKFLALYRINIAKRLLKNSRLSVTGISEKVGFQDSNYFSATFRRLARCSPSQYRCK